MSKICLTIAESSLEQASQVLHFQRPWIGMAELRVDALSPHERPMAASWSQQQDVPLILTLRREQDGGFFAPEEEEQRCQLFCQLLQEGSWAYADVEWDEAPSQVLSMATASGVALIRSLHDFTAKTLNSDRGQLVSLINHMSQDGAMAKLALCCESSCDLLSLARLAIALEEGAEKVLLGMGEFGQISRIFPQAFGSKWTYATATKEGNLAQLGQLTPQILQELYRCCSYEKGQPLFAVVGNPIAHSKSPQIHNQWFQEEGLNGHYIPLRSDDLGATLETCDLLGVKGLSVTVPHKETALWRADVPGDLARRIGAANTLLRGGDGWRARNTDAHGFLAPLPQALGLTSREDLRGMRALVIGAGGAARAVVQALSDAKVRMVILNRREEKARELLETIPHELRMGWGNLSQDSASLLGDELNFAVQTTPVGMHPHELENPLPWWNFSGISLAYDLIYEPEESCFLAQAKAHGVATLNGRSMLEAQARCQFEMFREYCEL
ncbi:MAG: type I 3-dehydroquinate dehydratase [Spirochaetales bacterium]|nr:type I 3-dehydroquinate dehydratase [Spirochaetales bacterium]